MKKIILLLLITINCKAQVNTEISKSYIILKENNIDLNIPVFKETKFEINSETIKYTNDLSNYTFNVISTDDDFVYDGGDRIFRVYCKNSEGNDVNVLFMLSEFCKKYIYILDDINSICFQIN